MAGFIVADLFNFSTRQSVCDFFLRYIVGIVLSVEDLLVTDLGDHMVHLDLFIMDQIQI